MPDQTLPDFLFAVITEQRKSVSSLVDALNEAKNGINQLSVSVERSEESRRQVETLLERQSVVEGDLKFDLTQCRQHNEVLQGQVKTLEENLERTEKLLSAATSERDGLSESLERSNTLAANQRRETVEYQDEITTLKLRLAAGTLDCVVPPAETPVASANEGETGLVLDEG